MTALRRFPIARVDVVIVGAGLAGLTDGAGAGKGGRVGLRARGP